MTLTIPDYNGVYKYSVADLRDYWHALAHHDWQFQYSDDHSVWTKGHDADRTLSAMAAQSPKHKALWDAWKEYGDHPHCTAKPPLPLRYLCDNARHMVCEPFSLDNLHRMAASLGLKRSWYHSGKFPHYDMPKRRIMELTAQCERVTQRQILAIIKEGSKHVISV